MIDRSPGPPIPDRSWWWQVPGVVALALLYLWPALGTGYWAEDVLFSLIPGEVAHYRISIVEKARSYSERTLREGRFYPVTPLLQTVPFHLLRSVGAYKAYLVALTIADVVLFYALARRLGRSPAFATLACCLVIALLQFRVFPDPILAYYGQMQLVAGLTIGALLMLLSYLDGGRWGWLAGATLAYLIGALTYEACYPMVLVPLLMIGRSRGLGLRGKLATALPFLAVVGTCIAATLLVRSLAHSDEHYVHHPSLAPVPALRALGWQASAALPLGYFLADPLDLFPDPVRPKELGRWVSEPRVAVVTVMSLLLCAAALGRKRKAEPGDDVQRGRLTTVAALGVMVAVLPGALLALSTHHRPVFAFGVGWVPVFVQYFGMALVLASATWTILRARLGGGPFGRWKCVGASSVVAVVMGLSYRTNEVTALAFNAPPESRYANSLADDHIASWHHHRQNIEAALLAGLLDEVRDGSRLLLANEYPVWHTELFGPWFYRMRSGKRLETPTASAVDRQGEDGVGASYLLRDVCLGRSAGFVVLSEVRSGSRGKVWLFVRHPNLFRDGRTPAMLLSGIVPEDDRPRLLRGRDLRVRRRGEDCALFDLEAGWMEPESITLIFDPIEASQVIRTARAGGVTELE